MGEEVIVEDLDKLRKYTVRLEFVTYIAKDDNISTEVCEQFIRSSLNGQLHYKLDRIFNG